MSDVWTLRRSFGPYISLLIIFSVLTVWSAVMSVRTGQWQIVESTSIGWFFFAVIVFIGTRHRIFWRDGVIVQKASGMSDVSIKTDEITRVEQETSDVGTALAMRRPFRRIVIYAEKSHGEGKHIDVSLKHFVADDVRKLMRAIHARRADLTLPKHWM